MNTQRDDFDQILTMLEDYFDGLYHGDIDKLRPLFHPDVVLKAPNLRLSLNDWLETVANRPIPAREHHPANFRILSVEVWGEQAQAKLDCPLFHYHYLDFLGLLKEDQRWRIVDKVYADRGAADAIR